MPWEIRRWIIAERFGWSLEYVDLIASDDVVGLDALDWGRKEAGR